VVTNHPFPSQDAATVEVMRTAFAGRKGARSFAARYTNAFVGDYRLAPKSPFPAAVGDVFPSAIGRLLAGDTCLDELGASLRDCLQLARKPKDFTS
jgi:hypothetical protein